MGESLSAAGTDDLTRAEFVRALDAAPDPAARAAAVEDHCRRHPHLADEFRDLGRGAGLVGPQEQLDGVPPGLLDRVAAGPVLGLRLVGRQVPGDGESLHRIPSHRVARLW
jgi:hypothetical protein